MNLDVISWTPHHTVRFLDQTLLPKQEVYREAATIDEMVEAIRMLRVRGAPLIGISAAMGLAAAAAREAKGGTLTPEWLEDAAARLAAARPTAVNLAWAVRRMRAAAEPVWRGRKAPAAVVLALRDEAQRIWDEDAEMCAAMGRYGAELIPAGATVMTHCNAGALATGGIGTAVAALYTAHEQGKGIRVVSGETRPLRQGARLTAWELAKAGVPVTSIVDSAAASLMAKGAIDLIITGADRIAANGDAANKIGTYSLAVLARAHGIPFYIAAPRSTFDLSVSRGADIPIEERDAAEVDAAPGAEVFNPAFDVTPAEYIAAIVTDRGIVKPPYGEGIRRLFD
jgi:methylthioribose-1-phosphate isomerase